MGSKREIVDAKEVEFLSCTAGIVKENGEDKRVAILTMRLQLGKFAPSNLSVNEADAIRLRDDLLRLFPRSKFPAKYWDG